MEEVMINGSDLGALLSFSEALRVAIIFKNGTFALTVLSDVVLLLSGGQCYGELGPASLNVQRQLPLLLKCLSGACWSLAAYVQFEWTLKACDFCKERYSCVEVSSSLQPGLSLWPAASLLGHAHVAQPEHLGWLWMCQLQKKGKMLAPHHEIMSLPQKIIDPKGHGISVAQTSLYDPAVPHNCSIHF